MSADAHDSDDDVQLRLAALEAAVARLTAMVEPAFNASQIAAPVAIPLLKEAAQHEFSAKFFALVDLGEALLKYSAAIAFAAAVGAGGRDVEEVMELFKQPPTLGKVTEGLRKTLDDSSRTGWPLDIVRTAFRRPNNKPTPTARYLLEDFIRTRNDERGHGAHQPEGYYQGLYLKNHLIVHDCVRACKHVQLQLLHIHAVDHLKAQYGYKTTLLMGGAATRVEEPIITSMKVQVGSTCLWDQSACLLPLNEFVTYRYCPTCTLEHIFFAERITSDRISYHSYFGNHRMTVDRTEKSDGPL
jgi:hypothetical protein